MRGTVHCNNTLIMIPDPESIGVELTGTYKFFGSTGKATGIIDNLDSTNVEDALSANQGRVLKEMIQSLMNTVKLIQAKMP